MKRHLIVYLHGIGDHLMATPAIHQYKQEHPDTELYLLSVGNNTFKDLWKHNSDITEVLLSTLTHNPHYGNPLFWITDYPIIHKDITHLQKIYSFDRVFFIVHFFIPAKLYAHLPLSRYRTHKSAIVAKKLGVSLHPSSYLLPLSSQEQDFAHHFFSTHSLRKKVATFHYLGSSPTKSLTPEHATHIATFLVQHGYTVIVLYSTATQEDVTPLHGDHIISYYSDNILHTAALIKKSTVFIGVDSGIAHVAAAVHTPVFTILMKDIWMHNSTVLGHPVIQHSFKKNNLENLFITLSFFLSSLSSR